MADAVDHVLLELPAGGAAVHQTCIPWDALQRLSPDVLAPMAQTLGAGQPLRLNTEGMSLDAVEAVRSFLSMFDTGTTSSRWLPETHSAVPQVHAFADKFGLLPLMKHIHRHYVLKQVASKACSVTGMLQRFQWHAAVVDALLNDLQTRVDHGVQAVDLMRILQTRALSLVLCSIELEAQASSSSRSHRWRPRAQGCVVIMWGQAEAALTAGHRLPGWLQSIKALAPWPTSELAPIATIIEPCIACGTRMRPCVPDQWVDLRVMDDTHEDEGRPTAVHVWTTEQLQMYVAANMTDLDEQSCVEVVVDGKDGQAVHWDSRAATQFGSEPIQDDGHQAHVFCLARDRLTVRGFRCA